jgi:hypothetical protein
MDAVAPLQLFRVAYKISESQNYTLMLPEIVRCGALLFLLPAQVFRFF